jgi:hypothetical protein
VLLIFGVASTVDRGASIVVRDADGKALSRHPLPDSGEFRIEYVHSYYGAPASERFSAGPRGMFELVEISSPSEAVLDYYRLEGRKVADGEWTRLVPKETRRFEELSLIGTEIGQKTLVLTDLRVPLFAESGSPVHLTLRVEEDTFLTEVLKEFYPPSVPLSVPLTGNRELIKSM